MKKILIILIVLLANFQTFSQIHKYNSINEITLDSGVVMSLHTYRLVRLKTLKTDSLIGVKNNVITNLSNQINVNKDEIKHLEEIIFFNKILIKNKDVTIKKLQDSNNYLIDKMQNYEPKIPFYKRKELYYGLLSGILLTLTLTK